MLNDSNNDRHRNHTNRIYSQGFQQFFKVVDWHISESTGHIFFVCAPRHLLSAEDGSYQGGSGGMLPQEIFKLKHLKKCCFQHFWTETQESVFQARLEFTQILRNDELQLLLLQSKSAFKFNIYCTTTFF